MEIIDAHAHIYPQKIAQKATDSIKDFYELEGGGMDGTVSMLLSRGATAGISKFVVLPVEMKLIFLLEIYLECILNMLKSKGGS